MTLGLPDRVFDSEAFPTVDRLKAVHTSSRCECRGKAGGHGSASTAGGIAAADGHKNWDCEREQPERSYIALLIQQPLYSSRL